MLLIRTINHLIGYIEQHLAKRLGVEPALAEKTLVEKLKIQIEPSIQSLPAVSQFKGSPVGQPPKPPTNFEQQASPSVGQPVPSGLPHPASPSDGRPAISPPQQPALPNEGKTVAPSGQLITGEEQSPVPSSDEQSGVSQIKSKPKEEKSAHDAEVTLVSGQLVAPTHPEEPLPSQAIGTLTTGLSKLNLQEAKAASVLPKLESRAPALRDFKAEQSTIKLDDIKVRVLGLTGPLTWGELVSASEEDFKTHLKNELKNEAVTDKKMYILARFKRQLQVLSERAKAALIEKERESTSKQDEESVDLHLLGLVKVAIAENLRLAKIVLEDAETTITLASWLPSLSFKSKPCKTEAILLTCEGVLTKYVEFCQAINAQRKLSSIRSLGSMVDVFPSTMQRKNALMLIDQRTSDYIVENLLTEAEYHAHKQLSLRLPKRLASHNESVGQIKRKTIIPSLIAFNEISQQYAEESEQFWEKTLEETDSLKKLLDTQTPYMAYYLGRPQRSTNYCEGLHTILAASAETVAPEVARKHKNCIK